MSPLGKGITVGKALMVFTPVGSSGGWACYCRMWPLALLRRWIDRWMSVWRWEQLLALWGCRVLAAAGEIFGVDGDEELGEREAAFFLGL